MTSTGLNTFDTTVQETNHWLKAMMAYLVTDDRHGAYIALKAGLHALRDRLGPENAVHFGAQLPTLLRGVFFESWRMAATPTREHSAQAFVDHVRAHLPENAAVDPLRATRATFAVIADLSDPGEVAKLKRILPDDLHTLWPDQPQTH